MRVGHCVDVERRAIGALLLAPALIGREEIKPEWFTMPAHRRLVSAVLSLPGAADMSPQTLADALRIAGAADAGELALLAADGAIPAQFPQYRQWLIEAHETRAVRDDLARAVSAIDDGEEPADIAGRIARIAESSRRLLPADAGDVARGLPFVVANASELPPYDEAEQMPYLVEGLIAVGTKTIVGSVSKGYKTTLLVQLGLTIAAGYPLWGRETRKVPVLYVNFELEPGPMEKRIRQSRDAMRIPASRLRDHFRVLTLKGRDVSPAELVDALVPEVLGYGAGLTVIDPVYRLMAGRDENSAGQVTALCIELDRLRRETGSGILYSGHFPKGQYSQKHNLDRIAGSGAWSRDADEILTYFPLRDPDGFRVECSTRYFKPAPPFAIRLSYPVFDLDPNLDVNNLSQANGTSGDRATKKAVSPQEVASLFEDGETINRTDLVKFIRDEFGVSQDTAYRAVKRAEESNFLGRTVPKGKKGYARAPLQRVINSEE